MDPRITLSRPLVPTGDTALNRGRPAATNFGQILSVAFSKSEPQPFKISAHAEKRLQERHLSLDGPLGKSLAEAFDELGAKGARDSLVVTPHAAFVVNVPSRTLVTALDLSELRDRVITHIDSVSVKK